MPKRGRPKTLEFTPTGRRKALIDWNDPPPDGWTIDDLMDLQINWNKYYGHMFRHPNQSINMLYLDGHVEPGHRSALHGGGPTFISIFPAVDP